MYIIPIYIYTHTYKWCSIPLREGMWGQYLFAQMKTLLPVNTDCHLNSIITVACYPLPIIAVCMLIRRHYKGTHTADPETFSAQMKTLSPVNTDCHLNSIITVASYLCQLLQFACIIRRHYGGAHIHPAVNSGALRTLRPRSVRYIKDQQHLWRRGGGHILSVLLP